MSIYKSAITLLAVAAAGAVVAKAVVEALNEIQTEGNIYPEKLKSCTYRITGRDTGALYSGSISQLNPDEVIVKVVEKRNKDDGEEEYTNILPLTVMKEIQNIIYKYNMLSWAELPLREEEGASFTEITIESDGKTYTISSQQQLPSEAYDGFNELIKAIDGLAGD